MSIPKIGERHPFYEFHDRALKMLKPKYKRMKDGSYKVTYRFKTTRKK
jgi:hypothetical protein